MKKITVMEQVTAIVKHCQRNGVKIECFGEFDGIVSAVPVGEPNSRYTLFSIMSTTEHGDCHADYLRNAWGRSSSYSHSYSN